MTHRTMGAEVMPYIQIDLEVMEHHFIYLNFMT